LRRDEAILEIAREEVVAFVVVERFAVRVPTAAAVAERLVEEAVVEKKEVVVAEEPVALVKAKRGKVFTAVVEVEVNFVPTVSPTIESVAYGEVVPTPTLPLFATIKFVAVEDPTTN
jgi:hypothetical protein